MLVSYVGTIRTSKMRYTSIWFIFDTRQQLILAVFFMWRERREHEKLRENASVEIRREGRNTFFLCLIFKRNEKKIRREIICGTKRNFLIGISFSYLKNVHFPLK